MSRSNSNRKLTLVVVDADVKHNWPKIVTDFEFGRLSDGTQIEVVQTSWMEMKCTFEVPNTCLLTAAPVYTTSGGNSKNSVTVRPDFILVRNKPRGASPRTDRRNVLFGLSCAGIPAINSLHSLVLDSERVHMVGELARITREVGPDVFPFVGVTYYSEPREMVIPPDPLPCVVKVSHAHAGMGKVLARSVNDFHDISTVITLHQDYCTAEPFWENDYGVRIQKIGNNYRAIKRDPSGSSWKSTFGAAVSSEIEMTDEFKRWADECSKCFGGIEILAVDALKGKNGKYKILELNTSAIGLLPSKWEEDTKHILTLVKDRMESLYVNEQKR
eukprot:TRINITY_DN33511_c0_g2_i1.p1 TRINITY_DN33511_c0_g2~~TRINITY_DN33511_c0_g2_i1.p1  ORF type:complete len:330 (-),score=86.12 TRINITY_DN33511_c0_g2_i1:172-1161(-)